MQVLARDLGVSEKTVRRDLLLFAGLGFPLSETRAAHGKKLWRIHANALSHAVPFSLDEAIALYLGRQLLAPLAGTVVGDAAQSALRKVRALLGPAALAYLEHLSVAVHFTAVGASDYRAHSGLLDELIRSIVDRNVAFVTYHPDNATEPVTLELHPYAIVQHKHSVYLHAFSREHGEVRTFKLDRMHAVEVTTFPFQRPDEFDPAAYLQQSFGVYREDGDVRVRVRFAPSAARYVQEGRWHASQEFDPQADGSVIASFRLSGTREISRWLLSFGRSAEVLAPETLRRELAAELEEMQRLYVPSGSA